MSGAKILTRRYADRVPRLIHSHEIAAVFLMASGITVARLLLGVVAFVRRAIVVAPTTEEQSARRWAMRFGEFVRCDGGEGWQARSQKRGTEFRIGARDVRDAPNPIFLERLPGILAALDSLELCARAEVDALSAGHVLDQISDHASADFVLGFSIADDAWCETVFVSFQDGRVVRWKSVN
jgi:hypothetical protein